MRAINHAITGSIIGLISGEPLMALPVAFLSHFVCDVIPHHGSDKSEQEVLESKSFKNSLVADAVLCLLLVVALAMFQPIHWQLAAVCAFLAASPDLFSFGRWWAARLNKPYKPNLYGRFAKNIQWFEHPIGGVVELVWFIAGLAILSMFVH